MADNKVTLEIGVDAKGATKEIKDFGNQAEMALKGVPDAANKAAGAIENIAESSKKASTGFGASVKSIVGGLAVFEGLKIAIGSVTDFLKDSVSGAMEAQVAFNELAQSLARAGTYTKENASAFEEYAKQLSLLSSIDDDVIMSQLAIARNFASTDEQAKKLVSSAADLSRAMGIDFATAVEYVGKTLDGTAGRLSETVPALRGLSEEALKAGGAIDVISKQFSGAALGYVQTYAGAIDQLSIQWGNYREAVGSVIVENPGIAAGINEVAKLFGVLAGNVSDAKKEMQRALNEGIIAMIDGIRALLPFINLFATGVKYLYEGMKFWRDVLISVIKGIGDLLTMMADAVFGIGKFGKAWDDFYNKFIKSSVLAPAFDTSDADDALKKIRDAIANADLNAEISVKNQDIKNIKDKIQVELNNLKIDLGGIAQIKEDIKGGQGPYGPFKEQYQMPPDNNKAFDLKDFDYGIAKILGKYFESETGSIKEIVTKFGKLVRIDNPKYSSGTGSSADFAYEVSKNFSAEIGGQIVPPLEVIPKEIADAINAKGSVYGPYQDNGSTGYKLNESAIQYPEPSFSEKYAQELEALKGGVDGFFQGLFENLSTATPLLGSLVKAGKSISGVFLNLETLPSIGSLITAPIDSFNQLADSVKSFGDAAASAAIQMYEFGSVLMKNAFASGIETIGVGLSSVVANLKDGAEGAGAAISETLSTAVGGSLDKLFGTNFIQGFIKSLLDIASKPDVLESLINSFIDAIPKVVSSIIKSLPLLFKGILKLLPVLFDGILRLIPELVKNIAQALPELFKIIGKYLPDIIIAIVDAIPVIVEAIADNIDILITALISALPRVVASLAQAVVNVAIAIVTKLIPNVIKGITDGIGTWFKNIMPTGDKSTYKEITKIGDAATEGASKAKAGFAKFWGKVEDASKSFATEVKNAWGMVKDLVELIANMPGKLAKALYEIDFKGALAQIVTDLGNAIFSKLPAIFIGFFQAIGTFFAQLSTIGSSFQLIIDGFLYVIESIASLPATMYAELESQIGSRLEMGWSKLEAIWARLTLGWEKLIYNINSIGPSIQNYFTSAFQSAWDKFISPLEKMGFKLDSFGFKMDNAGDVFKNKISEGAQSITDSIVNTWNSLTGGKNGPRFLTNTKAELTDWGKKLNPFATGGVVPNGFPGDSYPASLSSGELVLPPKTTGNLFSLIDGMANGEAPSGNNNETNNLLRQLIALIASQSTEVNVQLDRNTLAKAILTLNKDNRRLA